VFAPQPAGELGDLNCCLLAVNWGYSTIGRGFVVLANQQVETTLRYARLYDSAIATDYGRAMADGKVRSGLAQSKKSRAINDRSAFWG